MFEAVVQLKHTLRVLARCYSIIIQICPFVFIKKKSDSKRFYDTFVSQLLLQEEVGGGVWRGALSDTNWPLKQCRLDNWDIVSLQCLHCCSVNLYRAQGLVVTVSPHMTHVWLLVNMFKYTNGINTATDHQENPPR